MGEPTEATTTDRRFATTLARGLSVLRAFRPSDDGLTNAEISERTDLPKSTVSRLTFTLQSLGYLTHARHHDRYRPGPALLVLGNMASASISFVDMAGPLMQRLADETGTLVLLLVRDGAKMLIVKTWRPRTVASLWLEVGHRLPFIGSSSGQTLLAALSPEQFGQALRDADGDRGLTPKRAEEIRREMAGQLMRRGFAIADPEHYFASQIHAVATPFQPRDLAEPVVFTCGAMPEMLSVERMEAEVGPALRTTVSELERILGQIPGGPRGDL
ncbi:transcriptional regulator, IclR family [Jannaschia faecimaris]|uniref:Transcriptional regulator, IclR family n=1 Tax=Jannaschia faecimaris TaxID=1244108 RepID=A0A1H3RJ25_9RHOB|nr:IclR family transcriptional regulator [Jannaschia faecimaris]SDZ24939.1 transcriptional regulator, IclR family [Jannaschia faecimaris]